MSRIKETGDSRNIYQNKPDKASFQHDMSYGDFKDLPRRTVSDNVLRDKALNITKKPKYDGYQRRLASVVHNFFDKKSSGSGFKSDIIRYQELARELHKQVIILKTRKFEKQKWHSSFIDNISGADLVDMQLISIFNKKIRLLLCFFYIYIKYAWVTPLEDKEGITINNAFQEKLDEANHKPNKTLVGKGRTFFNRSKKSWLQDNDKEMYSTHKEGKFVAAERFIKTLKNKICKYMTSTSKSGYIHKLADIVNK